MIQRPTRHIHNSLEMAMHMWNILSFTLMGIATVLTQIATDTSRTFPPGIERNTIRNPPPNGAEMKLLHLSATGVGALLQEWRKQEGKIPLKLDWRKRAVLTPVQDQKYCSASYAFAAVAILEAQFKIKHGELKSLSAQQLIDCSTETYGCAGGRAHSTYGYIEAAAGLMSNRDYPWEGRVGQCRYQRIKEQVQVKELSAFSGAETIRFFVWKKGPVIAHINPAALTNDYPGYIIQADAKTCDPGVSRLTHMVVIVGFGESASGVKYWIVRNSWGPRWGYAGYFHIERGANACGIETLAVLYGIE